MTGVQTCALPISIFQKFGYSNKLSFLLASLCTLDNNLPQGAATSPTISNIIAKRIDARLYGLSKSLKLRYSRYADDIAFSGEYIPSSLNLIVSSILIEEGFKLNHKKTKLITGGDRKSVV